MTSSILVGLDLGTLTTKTMLALSKSDKDTTYELVRTSHGHHDCPTSISFGGCHRPRMLGEDSLERGDENTVGMLDRLLVDSLGGADGGGDDDDVGDQDPFQKFQRFTYDREKDSVCIPNMADDGQGNNEYSSTALLAMLLGRIKRNVLATVHRLEGTNEDGDEGMTSRLKFVFAVPPNYSTATRQALMDAAYAVSISNSMVVDSTLALGKVLEQRKFSGEVCGSGGRKVMVVEMGHARTNISLLRFGGGEGDDEGDAQEEKKNKEPNDKVLGSDKITVLANVNSSQLGAGTIDICLYHHFLATHPAFSNVSFETNSRSAQRLLEGCKKLKHLLSMLSEGSVTVESIGKNESDVTLSANRELLVQLCDGLVTKVLKSMIQRCIEKAGGMQVLNDIATVELTGGGCRIPLVQDTVRDCLGKKGDETFSFSKSLDDTSLALGAAMMMTAPSSCVEDALMEVSPERQARREALLHNEMLMSKRDEELVKKDEIRNQIEAHILELRSARHSSVHSSLLPTSDEFTNFLDGTDDWLFSAECDDATFDEMMKKWVEVKSKSEELCADFLEAKRLEAERKDREMEEEAKQAAAERDAEAMLNGDDGNDADDHDTRKLPTKRRMEIVMKNKAEANELFGDGNYKHACARYAKALSHCNKFFDLSPDDEVEVKEVKLSLHVNMALSFIKLEKLDNAFQSCNEALAIDPKNVKALYRRATVQHSRRKFDDALNDLKQAEELAPDDKAVKKLRRLVDHEILKQKKKEQAMAKKMFG
ncbi:hypothetical protein HJC23_013675 [Cyclotella cryptica]|uniref:Uncharacterized protein n=1 Tax=Cyclotella cryptica TaxID=29204 RepID=A0ABD3QX78_9STRA|eukprot:CCRYP_001512-RA/>CCRYP_001512-RA protein AED:0.28 eAED:0.28 QI:234/1/1/1/0.5/0.33/3/1550/764